jgi:two-component system chemotaxis sensor kinase CheA
METKDTALLAKLRGLFAIEADEHLQAITTCLLALEKDSASPAATEAVETLFREVHTLKGAARAVNLTDVEAVCQVVESVCAALKRKEFPVWPEFFDTLHRAMDTVRQLSLAAEGASVGSVAGLVEEISQLEAQGRAAAMVTPESDQAAQLEPVATIESAQSEETLLEQIQHDTEQPVQEVAQEVAANIPPEGASQLAGTENGEENLSSTTNGKRRRGTAAPRKTTTKRPRTSKKKSVASEAITAEQDVAVATHDTHAAMTTGESLAAMSASLPEEAYRSTAFSIEPEGPTQAQEALSTSTSAFAARPDLYDEQPESFTVSDMAEAQSGITPDAATTGYDNSAQQPEHTPRVVGMEKRPNTAVSAAPARQAGAIAREKGPGTKRTASSTETVRIAAAKLDALFLQAEEMLAVKLKTNLHATELRGLASMLEAWKREWAKVHTDIRKTQRLLEKEENRGTQDPIYVQAAKLVDFLDWTHDHLKAVERTLLQVTRAVAQDQQSLGGMVDILLEDAKKVLMLPFASALEVLPKMVRDLSRAQGKEVDLTVQGGEVEIDKRILEDMKDPLIHILRNCIDHGIESPIEREQQQKSSRGTISIAISPSDGNTVQIVVADDGAGIDAGKVRAAAVKCGLLSQKAAEQLTEQEAIALIFQSEVSTSSKVSDISGRGLGMAIVREKVEKLGGQIAVETQRHQGSTFRIRLPLTLATFRGIQVQTAGQTFVVPTANVERVVRIKRDDIRTVGNKETISLAGYTLPLVRLDRALSLATKAKSDEGSKFQLALVVGQDERQLAFGVDMVVNEQEVLFKSLGQHLVRVRNIAGATVLGSGHVAPVLNVSDLLASAGGNSLALTMPTLEAQDEAPQPRSILVAEDSITSRMLLKEILESAGYLVSTAIDGEDAFSTLQKAKFDLVVSDVEMPRMNGFALTSKIRTDGRYTQLPVVLVTGLETQADRERGIDAGANAYVVKGSFDQSNLLETIRRLI